MTAVDCPRCHGKGWALRGSEQLSLRLVNVMGSTRTNHYRCSECSYTELRHYDENGVEITRLQHGQRTLGEI
jgi:hypothetical protein